MRRTVVLALVGCLAATVPANVQAQDKDAQAIIDKAIKAHGGLDKLAVLDKPYTAKAKGIIVLMDMNLDFKLEGWAAPPTKSKAVIDVSFMGMQLQIIQVFNGDKGWVSVAGDVKEVEKEDMDEHKHSLYVESVTNLTVLKTDKEIKMSPLGDSKVNDTPVVGVQVKKDKQRDVNLYFDKKTFLLLKAEYRAKDGFTKLEVNQEKFYSDYKEMLPGIKMAAKQVTNNDGKKYMEVEMTEARSVDRFDDSIFAKPK
jgi:hypothetical protein